MTDSKIQPGTFVRHDRLGVGKVMAVNGNPSILFWANRESGRTEKIPAELLTLLQDDSPEVLLWESPEELASWATGKPLPLVALALFFGGGTGKVADIKEKLDSRVILDGQWNKWWKKRTKPLANLPKCFEVVKTSKGNQFRLLSSVDAVPTDWTPPAKPKSAILADWKDWLDTDASKPPPGRYPTKEVCDALANWPVKDINNALACTIRGAEEFLSSEKRPSKQAAEAWMEAVSQASAQQREYGNRDNLEQPVGELLRELARIAGRDKVVRVLADAFVAPERYAGEMRALRNSLNDANTRHARELTDLQKAHITEIDNLSKSRSDELKEIRLSHEAELERERREQERLQEKASTFEAQMRSGREESRLEVRHGMLLAVGDALQRAYLQGKSAEDRLSNVITTLPNALREGGAATLGTVGATVKYDPKFHHSPEAIPSGVKVRLAAPGVVVGKQVILKASVSTETEVC